MAFRLPHPILLLLGGVAVAAALTWVVPAGEYQRVVDDATGRTIAVAGTYQAVPATPVTLFGAVLAVPRGLAEGVEVIVTILMVGGAWYLVDRLGTLGRVVNAIASRCRPGSLTVLPILIVGFALMGAAENMQEEIIALVPTLLVLGTRLRVDAVTMVGASAGAAIVGSAFGPTNPFQAGIALTLAELPLLSGAGLRAAMFGVGVLLWIWWTLRWAARHRLDDAENTVAEIDTAVSGRDGLILACATVPLMIYVFGVFQWEWGFNELSAVYLVGGILAGVVGRWTLDHTVGEYLAGMQIMLPAAVLVGVARSIALVLQDGRIIDSILHSLATPLSQVPTAIAALLMIPVQAIIHIPVSSVSGQAALTMPILIPLSDLIGLSRQITVLAYQSGAGLTDMITPTNGALMAVLLAAAVPFTRWMRFAIGGYAVMMLVGVLGIVAGLVLGI